MRIDLALRLSGSGRALLVLLLSGGALIAGMTGSLVGACGPFTDVSDAAFCPYVLEIFTLGVTTGTTPTTYDPAASVSRLQMAAFLSRTVDRVAKRGSRRSALRQFWRPSGAYWAESAFTTVGVSPVGIACDGQDIWVANNDSDTVSRVRASDGRLLENWIWATAAYSVLPAMGRIAVTGSWSSGPGNLYIIDPREPAGIVTKVASTLGETPVGLACDGTRFWTANNGYSSNVGSISIITPQATIPWTVTTITSEVFTSFPQDVLYDGSNIWVTDFKYVKKLDSSGSVLQTVTSTSQTAHMVFDGTNLWVTNNTQGDFVMVVRASTGAVLATLTGNGLSYPGSAAFDGERVLVVNQLGSLSLFKAADLTPLGTVSTGIESNIWDACSDGVNFWVSLFNVNGIARF